MKKAQDLKALRRYDSMTLRLFERYEPDKCDKLNELDKRFLTNDTTTQ
jgi:hypothetical protein